ncbi:MAG: hypothetical protein PHQ28_14080 [Mycobacterium sp.]|nr:hypothetical protein [Mycobacterium sp.]
MNGINSRTGTVHNTRHDGRGLVQTCGIKANQHCYLDPTQAPITCKRCANARPAKRTVAPAPTGELKLTPAMRKALAEIGTDWTSWSSITVGDATLNKLVAAGLIESRFMGCEWRKI